MNGKCNENLYVKPVEICNFKALKKLKIKTNKDIYDSNLNKIFKDELQTLLTDLNYEFRNQEDKSNEFKFKEKKDKKHFCGLINDEDYYLNCVIQTNNPLFTFKDGNCVVNPEVLGTTFNRVEVNGEISLFPKDIKDEEGNFKYSHNDNNNKFCEDRWFDWIITPNYHFGNRVYKDSGAYSKEDVKKCYIPCGNGYLPYTSSNGINMCVPKEIANDGLYANKLDYSPIALINLIGNSKQHLNKLYRNLFLYKLNNKLDTFDINDNHKFIINLENEDNYIINNALKNIKEVLENIVNDNNIDIPDYSNEYKHLTYKHPYFKEDDLLTLDGLDKNDILSNDIILIHTAYLATEYKDFLNKFINDDKTEFLNKDKKLIEIEKFNENPFNINNVLKQNGIIRYLNKFPNTEVIITNEFKDKYPDIDKTKIIRQRLANILYKAINICYDGKTDFSNNIIYKTEQAIKKYDANIIKDNIIKDNIIKFKTDNHYDLTKLSKLNELIIITYLKKDELDEIYNKYDTSGEKNSKIGDANYFGITSVSVYPTIKDFYDGFKKNFINNFIFYTEENSEIIKNNSCNSGKFRNKDGNCVDCENECNTNDICKNNNDCKIYCNVYCKKLDNNDVKDQSICGIKSNGDETNDYINKEEIKTPIEEETNIPNFSYIFKSAIRIFFILIIIYIGYMFYKLFNEQIMTIINAIFGFFDWIRYYLSDDIKRNEYYKDVIQNKYNRIIRKTMS